MNTDATFLHLGKQIVRLSHILAVTYQVAQ
jgi:hypothetical protein